MKISICYQELYEHGKPEKGIYKMKEVVFNRLKVRIFPHREIMGKAAAEWVGSLMRKIADDSGKNIRMVFAAAPSQDEFLKYLRGMNDLPWEKVTAFHMDDYIGLPSSAPQRFSNYLKEHLFSHITPGKVYFINPENDPEKECDRYANLLMELPIDIVCMGIGENGHVAFNDPPVADFNDPLWVKIVELDEKCRRQQVNDGCFNSIGDVPEKAITLTVPALMSARYLSIVVPGKQKSEAVYRTLKGPLDTSCPASCVRSHPSATLFLDEESACCV